MHKALIAQASTTFLVIEDHFVATYHAKGYQLQLSVFGSSPSTDSCQMILQRRQICAGPLSIDPESGVSRSGQWNSYPGWRPK